MSAHVQWHAGTLRLFPGTQSIAEADTFEWACTVVVDPEQPTRAILAGAMTAPPVGARREIARALLQLGYDRVKWQRKTGGRHRWVEFPLTSSP